MKNVTRPNSVDVNEQICGAENLLLTKARNFAL